MSGGPGLVNWLFVYCGVSPIIKPHDCPQEREHEQRVVIRRQGFGGVPQGPGGQGNALRPATRHH